jgi:hypothetical protein
MTIGQYCTILTQAGIRGVDLYEKKLQDSAGDAQRVDDLQCEGRVALIFQKHGWSITMRESPDLEGRLNGIFLGIEVKHFRYKPKHDPVEDAALSASGPLMARIPFLNETEGNETAWGQMYRFAAKNAHQYFDGEFNVLFFVCSTQAHFDGTLETAVNIYDEKIQEPSCDPAMRNLTAIMMNSIWCKVGLDRRSIFWKPIWHAQKGLTEALESLLDQIREE